MRLHRGPARRRRGGFTLIEMLIVVAIIIVLASLLSSAVFGAFTRMWEVGCRKEIGDLAGGITQFEKDFNVSTPPPSVIWLDGSGPTAYQNPPAGYTAAQVQQLAVDSQAYLRKVWPRINIQGGIAWNSGINGRSNNVILEGEESLVFFLGGAQDPNTGAFLGFSADPSNPMNPSASIKRKGPYFQFQTTHVATSPTGSGFPVYLDTYAIGSGGNLVGKPYAYFSSGKTANGYNAYAGTFGADCKTLGNFGAYNQPAGAGQAVQYYNPDTFQIISAGYNQTFGPGGAWLGTTADLIGKAGGDDVTNFTSRKLGAPQ
jgi:prepilin-type N-terminal cleavage/methylation domain-containing protein